MTAKLSIYTCFLFAFFHFLPAGAQVFVNQSGYNTEWPKRFTAPLAAEGADFELLTADTRQVRYRGKISAGIGDFTAYTPLKADREYIIRVDSHYSDPFRIAPFWLQQVSLAPALQFMIDSRSVVGTHASAYGGAPWRDGTYYSFEVPSLVMLYLANPGYFRQLPAEIDYNSDKEKVLAPGFGLASREPNDEDALETVKRYYQELDAPAGSKVPDIIQLIHWGIGFYLIDPETHDPSGDPKGNRIHDQTVEQFAFFLYGYPFFRQYFTEDFYRKAHDFAFSQWDRVGLFDVKTAIGTAKGRECPGHSILPNLLMYEVALREDRQDAEKFFRAAFNQAQWIVDSLDFANPKVTKGQRMSEHKLYTGLIAFLEHYPDRAPAGLKMKMEELADITIERSENMWDFRKYSDSLWTLPKHADGLPETNPGWNEPGNLAAFPAIGFGLACLMEDPSERQRLREVSVAHFDNLFGRNPVGAHTANRGVTDYKGVERGWPVHYTEDVTARMELIRGAISSSAATEHYPFDPEGAFRWPEGWVAFNAAFNVGLAYACRQGTEILINRPAGLVTLRAPVNIDSSKRETVHLNVYANGKMLTLLSLKETGPGTSVFEGTLNLKQKGQVMLSYGHGMWRTAVQYNSEPQMYED